MRQPHFRKTGALSSLISRDPCRQLHKSSRLGFWATTCIACSRDAVVLWQTTPYPSLTRHSHNEEPDSTRQTRLAPERRSLRLLTGTTLIHFAAHASIITTRSMKRDTTTQRRIETFITRTRNDQSPAPCPKIRLKALGTPSPRTMTVQNGYI